ncbi:hypothetical protein I79_014342 [Cricetulus griseus]|uniref:Uncharacterized protein n=1 Tax=Cricetulus griseus TaxID=10029 RepID=G3HTW2_CRIGR|nr:hypothetical protein I79_014342 [Cricetulus griseus]
MYTIISSANSVDIVQYRLGVAVTLNPSPQEAETGGYLSLLSHLGLYSDFQANQAT